jgi:hypothetical protein
MATQAHDALTTAAKIHNSVRDVCVLMGSQRYGLVLD